MVWLSGPKRGGGRTKPIILNDPPPRLSPAQKVALVLAGERDHARVIVRVATVTLVVAVAAVAVITVLMMAGYH